MFWSDVRVNICKQPRVKELLEVVGKIFFGELCSLAGIEALKKLRLRELSE